MSMRYASRDRSVHPFFFIRYDSTFNVDLNSLEYGQQHPDPASSDTPPSSPSDLNSHPRRVRRTSRSQPPGISTKRRTRPSTATGTETTPTAHTTTHDDDDGDSQYHRTAHHRHHRSTSSSRFLSRLMAGHDSDSRKMSSMLVIANERLEVETTRANEAERKASELIRRFKEVLQTRDTAVQESGRVKEVCSSSPPKSPYLLIHR